MKHTSPGASLALQNEIDATLKGLAGADAPTRQERFAHVVKIAAENPDCTLDLSETDLTGIDVTGIDFANVNLVVRPEQLLAVKNLDKAANLPQELLDKAKVERVLHLLDTRTEELQQHIDYAHNLAKLEAFVCDGNPPDLSGVSDETFRELVYTLATNEDVNLVPKGPLRAINLQVSEHPERFTEREREALEADLLTILQERHNILPKELVYKIITDKLEGIPATFEGASAGPLDAASKLEKQETVSASQKEALKSKTKAMKALMAEGKETVKELQTDAQQQYIDALITNLDKPKDPGLGLDAKGRLQTAINIAKYDQERDGTETGKSPLTLDFTGVDTHRVDFSGADFTGCNVTIEPQNLTGTKNLGSVKGIEPNILADAKALQPEKKAKEPSQEQVPHAPEKKRGFLKRALSWASRKFLSLFKHKEEVQSPEKEALEEIKQELKHASREQIQSALEILTPKENAPEKPKTEGKPPKGKERRTKALSALREGLKDATPEEIAAVRDMFRQGKEGLREAASAETAENIASQKKHSEIPKENTEQEKGIYRA